MHRPVAQEGGGLSAIVGPEVVAAVLSVAVVVALLASRLAFTGGPIIPPASPSPSPSAGPTASASSVDTVLIGTLLQVNANLATLGADLETALKTSPLDVATLRITMANMQPQITVGLVAAGQLKATPGGASVGGALETVYNGLRNTISDTLTHATGDQVAARAGALKVVEQLKQLSPLNSALTELLTGPSPGGSPIPTVAPTPTPSPSPSPSPTTEPSLTPIPTEPSPTPLPPPSTSPSVAPGPNVLLNPGFEQGVGPPWALFVIDPAQATTVADPLNPGGGSRSARIDVAAPSNRQIDVSEQQPGLTIEAGAYYRITLSARGTAIRDIRIRIIGPDGQLLGNGSKLVQISTAWASYSFDMTSFAPATNASIAIDVGGNGGSVWLDDVSVGRIPSNAP